MANKSLIRLTGRGSSAFEIIEDGTVATMTLNGDNAATALLAEATDFTNEQVVETQKRLQARELPKRCNPILKPYLQTRLNGAASALVRTYGLKLWIPCDFYAIRLHFFNHNANTPDWNVVVGQTETAATDTGANLSQPIVGGTSYTSLDSTTVGYGWRTVTFSGSSTGTHSAGGTAAVPSVLSSDIIPITSVARADGGTGRLLMVRCASPSAATQGYSFAAVNAEMRTPTAANRGFILQAFDTAGTAATTTPSGASPTSLSTSIIPFCVEVFTHANGSSVMFCGDSLTEAAANAVLTDRYMAWGQRAAMDLTTEQDPIGFINVGYSSQASSVFYPLAVQFLNLLKPSVAFYPIWTPNDYSSPASEDVLRANIMAGLARAARFVDDAATVGTKVILWTGLPHSAAGALTTAAKDNVRKQINTLIKSRTNVVIADFDAFVSDGATPAAMLSAYSLGDGVHLSEAGHEAVGAGPAKDALKAMLML